MFNCHVRKKKLILGGGLGEQCRVAWELTLVKGFFSDCGGTRPYIWVDWTLAILFISYFLGATNGCTRKQLFFCLYSN